MRGQRHSTTDRIGVKRRYIIGASAPRDRARFRAFSSSGYSGVKGALSMRRRLDESSFIGALPAVAGWFLIAARLDRAALA